MDRIVSHQKEILGTSSQHFLDKCLLESRTTRGKESVVPGSHVNLEGKFEGETVIIIKKEKKKYIDKINVLTKLDKSVILYSLNFVIKVL